jgi:DUF1365 family protein
MEITPQLFTGNVMHKRLFPRVNQFTYGIYYLACPLNRLSELNDGWRLGHNRAACLSIHDADHGARDGTALESWIGNILRTHQLDSAINTVTLLTLPRVLGYVFNPVSFWLCHDIQGQLRAVLCEVNNTFGETHSYLCAHADHRPILADDWLDGEKLFHVSPFLAREGSYRFRFAHTTDHFGAWIDYMDASGKPQLLTSLSGRLSPLSRSNLRHAFWRHPLVTLKAVLLIHWQALKLVAKGIRYIPKPAALAFRLSTTRNLTKL